MFSTFAIATMYAISSNLEPVYTGRSSVRWDATGMLLVDPVYTGVPLGDPANIAGHTGTPLKNLVEAATLECLWKNSDYCSLRWNTTGWTITAPTHTQAHMISRVPSMPVWNEKMTGHQTASGHVSVKSALLGVYCSPFAYQFCSSNMWVLQHHSVYALDMSTIIVFMYYGDAVRMKSAKLQQL